MIEVKGADYWRRVRDLMEEKKVTLNALASALGVSVRTVYSWTANDRLPSADKAVLISIVLDADPVKLMFGEQAPDPESLRLSAGVASSVEAKGKRMAMEEVQRLAKELEALKQRLVSEQA